MENGKKTGIVALTLSPMMSSKLLRGDHKKGWFARKVESVFDGLKHRYVRILQGTLKSRGAVYIVWIVIAMAIFSWLVAFNVVNTRNHVVAMVGDFLYRVTDPALRPIRNMLPNLGGIAISPVILFLIIIFIEKVIEIYILPNVF